jgi:hypothetical protein
VTVEVAGDPALGELQPGSRVDVLVSTESAGGGRTTMPLAGVELLWLGDDAHRYSDGTDPATDGAASDAPTALATLRVSLLQAIALTRADNFAREIRLLPRPPGAG